MRRVALALALAAALGGPGVAGPPPIWADEFDGPRLDPASWTPAHDCWGGGNEERQCYTPDNVRVADGMLVISARRELTQGPASPHGGGPMVLRDFSSGRVDTRGAASFMFGRIEVRAKAPSGQGLWSAIWLLPEHDNYGPFPASGEIDIAEIVNLGVRCPICRDQVHAAVHHGPAGGESRQTARSTRLPRPDAFHIYGLAWTPREMVWTLDGLPYHRIATRPPFDQRFHLILNLAVGGGWPEGAGRRGLDPSALPAELRVDWVRVYAN